MRVSEPVLGGSRHRVWLATFPFTCPTVKPSRAPWDRPLQLQAPTALPLGVTHSVWDGNRDPYTVSAVLGDAVHGHLPASSE